MGAALSKNLGATWSPQVWSSMTSEIPSHLFAESIGSELSKQRKRKATEEAKARRRQSKYSLVWLPEGHTVATMVKLLSLLLQQKGSCVCWGDS